MSTKIFGITGNVYSGKSEFCSAFSRNTFTLHKGDRAVHEELDYYMNVTSPHNYAIWLKEGLHQEVTGKFCNHIADVIERKIDFYTKEGFDFVLFDWFLLPYVDAWDSFDKRIVITADDETRVQRRLATFTPEQREATDLVALRAQMQDDKFLPANLKYDLLVENNGNDNKHSIDQAIQSLIN
ncbi:MAG: hypothetical protein FWC00_05310 [Firmicutes bacterium]|nr:hypothetical protein [Bacillota bacterium]